PPPLHAAARPQRLLRCGSGGYRLRPRLRTSGAFQRLVRRAANARRPVFTTGAAATRAFALHRPRLLRNRAPVRYEILFQRAAGHRRQLAHDAVGGLARDRQLALALEFLDRGLSVGIDDSARLDLAVAVFGERPLQRDHAFGSRRPLDDAIAANR